MRKSVILSNVKASVCPLLLNRELVTTFAKENGSPYEYAFNHWTAVSKLLAEPWPGSDRIVCAESYFASVQSALALLNIALIFIGVVKMATTGFPMKYMSEMELEGRGSHYSMVSDLEDSTKQLIALV